ncbi:4-hydroxy-tetrahydrodipicolinate synthase [Denitrobacterium detoxificans]|jgi:4-hydroxy-tetrahydrodipicolinate synthase|uniref:4-hydroxy-tetrahydrodipicolinate synthase n=1 Tax=Denitrobacterium detoxificans TaxID=79604 RepID=UPI0026EF4F88|nr:4-hydroxy-tetrahydrodipicolinate synthase [Denitrobacterium detoxificans]MBE6466099.1 4-hydroxy-tetrahydrodipicolinate synthase [Denitrobacterium detoxificans]
MSSTPVFGRLIPAMVTAFDENLQVDVEQNCKLAKRLLDGGCDSVLLFGTTGEGPTIHVEKKLEVIKAVVDMVAGRAPVIANVGTNCTEDSIEMAKKAAACGVDGLMAVVPFYNKPPQEGLYRHFRAIAEAVDLPIILYNIPGRCGINMTAETTLRLARDCANIVAVKEASGNLDQIAEICDAAPEGFVVYSGDDALTYEVMKRGGVGVISTTANCAPAAMKKIVDNAAQGNWEAAASAHEAILPLMKGLFLTANPILVKKALNLQGFNVGSLRLPLVDATPEQAAQLAETMRVCGVLD